MLGCRQSLQHLVSLALAGAAVGAPAATSAQAERAAVTLVHSRDARSEVCSDEPALRSAVAARLGYDPFIATPASDVVTVQVSARGGGFEGRITRHAPGSSESARPTRIQSRGSDCAELDAALAVAVAIAVDPLSLTRAPEPPPAPAPSAPPPPPPPAPLAQEHELEPDLEARAHRAAAPERHDKRLHVGLGPSLSAGVLPRVTYGAHFLAGFSYDWFEVDLGARFDAPVQHDVRDRTLRASLVLGSVAPCGRLGWVVACLVGSVGQLRGEGVDFDLGRERDTLYAALGTRWSLELPLWRALFVRVLGETVTPVTRTHLAANGSRLWSTPPLGFSGGAMLVGRLQ
jgi:hypothetical protein